MMVSTLWIKLYSEYEYEVHYHLGKKNVVTDALSRKERVKTKRVRAMAMTIQLTKPHYISSYTRRFQDVKLARIYINEIIARIGILVKIKLRVRWMIYLAIAESVRDAIGFEYYLASSSGWTKSLVLRAEIGESSLTGLELVQETTDKVVLVKEKPKAMRDRQKSYVDYRCKTLEFEVGDRVLLKVMPWKGVVRFGKKGKLAPRYVETFGILERIGSIAYRLRLPKELSSVHDTFHVSNLKKMFGGC
nr:putative reverse transcriptase domain-containing protein [Tanacetum cinerariifolium]